MIHNYFFRANHSSAYGRISMIINKTNKTAGCLKLLENNATSFPWLKIQSYRLHTIWPKDVADIQTLNNDSHKNTRTKKKTVYKWLSIDKWDFKRWKLCTSQQQGVHFSWYQKQTWKSELRKKTNCPAHLKTWNQKIMPKNWNEKCICRPKHPVNQIFIPKHCNENHTNTFITNIGAF